MELAKCPYCKTKLEKIPTKKIKCKFCSKNIFVRTLPPKMQKVLIKEEEVKKIEQTWIEYLSNSFWVKELEKIGESKKGVVEMYYILKERFGTTPLIADVMWGFFNNATINAIKQNDREKQKIIQNLMDEFKSRERGGKDLWSS